MKKRREKGSSSSALIQKMNRMTELETRFELNQAPGSQKSKKRGGKPALARRSHKV